ncbi:MAG: M23 family metallopeptidase [Vicinamibacterales bacterium]
MLVAVTAVQAGVPLALLAWIAWRRTPPRGTWLAAILAAAAWIAASRLAGLWLLLPPWLPLILFIALALALLRSAAHVRGASWRPRSAGTWMELAAMLLGVAAGVWLGAAGITGRRLPAGAPAVDLALPFHDGRYYVANGGSNGTVNAHVATLERERLAGFRGQSFAVDLTAADGDIAGRPVVAPCAGTVVEARNDAPDEPTATSDPNGIAGNFVFLQCGGAQVLLGHLQRGSVAAQPGDAVMVGAPLGRAGNSGNSDWPHLHLHVQQPAAAGAPMFSGSPVHARIDGRFVARNDILDAAAPRPDPARVWTPAVMLYAQLGSILVSLLMLGASLRSATAGRLLFVALFAWAAQVNLRTALDAPGVYLDYAPLAALDVYRRFIGGFFAAHVTAIVSTIAAGQAIVAVLLLFRGRARAAGLAGAIVFLLAIVPLGTGSGFPATLIMAMAAAYLLADFR